MGWDRKRILPFFLAIGHLKFVNSGRFGVNLSQQMQKLTLKMHADIDRNNISQVNKKFEAIGCAE